MKTFACKVFILINFAALFLCCKNEKAENQINTVQGPINVSELGLSLTHEHIMSNFGKEIAEASTYDSIKLFNQVIPYLKKLKSLGVNSVFDCTTEYFGRRID